MFRRVCSGFVVLLLSASWRAADSATEIDGKPNNPYGVQMGMPGSHFSDYASLNWQWASDLVGEWGHVRVQSGIHSGDEQEAIRAMVLCRSYRLIPIFTGLYVPKEYRIPGGRDTAPYVRDDGYPLGAELYRKWARSLARVGAMPPYYEVGNEVNGKWEPEAYGRYLIAVSRALNEELPGIRIVSAGLAGNGADFLDELLTAVPEVVEHVDAWGLHPYGANHPPSYEKDGYCLKGHLWTARALAKHGIDNPRFVMTECNYEVGNWNDPNYPRITDELRARYMVRAYENIWAPDPRVVTLTYFFLHAATWPGWDSDVLVAADGTKSRTYNALAAVPKPSGSDWMPGGSSGITGKVTDHDTGQRISGVFVYTVPGLYAARTGPDGAFTIRGIPGDRYEIHAFRDGYANPDPVTLDLADGATREYLAHMERIGILERDMEGNGPVVTGWNPSEASPDSHWAADPEVGRTRPGSQRLTARPGSPVGLWKCTGYSTVMPDRAYAAEVYVRGENVTLGYGAGVTVALSITDPYASPLSTVRAVLPLEGDFDWTPVAVTIPPFPGGRRLRLDLSFDAEEGTVWLDDPYIHYADCPVPSRTKASGEAEGTAALSGEVMGANEERLQRAVIFLNPGNYWALSADDGTYRIEGIPEGTYTARAVSRGWDTAGPNEVAFTAGEESTMDFVLPKPPAPREIVNPGFELGESRDSLVPGWTRYAEIDGTASSGWHPELPEHPEGVQARSGNQFAGSIAGYNTKCGGIYQALETDPGETYTAGVWVYTYQTDDSFRGDVASRLGIDPTGGTDPNGPYVIWTQRRPSHKKWSRVELSAVANTDRMTVFLDAYQVMGRQFVLNIFDDVTFRKSDEPLPPELSLIPEAGSE